MEPTKLPGDVDLVLVELALQFIDEHGDEPLYLVHKALDGHSLKSHTLRGVNDEVYIDGAVPLFCMGTFIQTMSEHFMHPLHCPADTLTKCGTGESTSSP